MDFAVRVSNRQYALLREVAYKALAWDRIVTLNQTTAGSLARRGLVKWNRDKEVLDITQDGRKILEGYACAPVLRLNEAAPVSPWVTKRPPAQD